MLKYFAAIILTSVALIGSVAPRIGIFDKSEDIGNPKLKGGARFDPQTNKYTMSGAGYNIWFERDEFQYLYKKVKGDFTASADFEFVGNGVDPHRKVGWMVRESLDGDASHISAVSHGDGLTVLQWRIAKGEKMRDPEDEIFANSKHYMSLQLSRKGKNYTLMAGKKGEKLELVGSHEMEKMPDSAFLGIYICSHNPDVVEKAIFSNVRIVAN